ncbi:hypothetical protein BKA82DRAFT_748425 [Pisolithus tinctorius]|uniref:BTB domain-containing protein n=1 Tax=Pisolithus tinctorius Marx 270 TaxID=870435 RepID=A0A0C3KRG7_PISTI|nr:hypothetical protein BKA82DRAFT_748425 [Pisolithus tinctorius]KIO12152.1 hypothetical protein M404DRAFT_748425 [Pisolithus tinctorius Marx 270]
MVIDSAPLSETTTMATNNEPSRHSDFYMSTVTFLVEDSLFRVPREPFQQESEVFCDTFSLPQGDGVGIEGWSDEIPIQLHAISKDDFEQLLKALFHRKHGSRPNLPQSIEQWTSVLKLSTAWNFEKLRQASIHALLKSNIGAVDRVVLSQQYDIKGWLLPALNELAKRPEPITLEEANRMGIDIALRLASVRERVTVQTACSYSRRDMYGYSGRGADDNLNVTVGSCRDSRMQHCDFSDQIRSTFSTFNL